MSNQYYTSSGWPAYSANGDSQSARSEFSQVEAAFNKLPALAANGLKIVRVNSGATVLEAVTLDSALAPIVTAATGITPTDTYEFPIVLNGSGALSKLTWAQLKTSLAALTTTWGISITGNAASATTAAACSGNAATSSSCTGNAASSSTCTGNAASVTNGVYTTGAGTVFLAPNGSAAALTNFPTLNQNTTGTATNATNVTGSGTISATTTGGASLSVSTSAALTNNGVLNTPASGNLANCTFPTLNQNTSGTAAGLSTVLAIASGGTGQSSAVNAFLALAGSQSNTGYVKLGGIIINWGTFVSSSTSNEAHGFAFTFPTACSLVIGSCIQTTPGTNPVFSSSNKTASGFDSIVNFTSISFGWIAIGY